MNLKSTFRFFSCYSPLPRRLYSTMSSPAPLHLQPTRIALIQLGCTLFDKNANIARARKAILEAASSNEKPNMIVLPECFNSPYGVKYFSEYAESLGNAYQRIKKPLPSALARMTKGNEQVRWTIDNSNCPETISKLAQEKGLDQPVQLESHILNHCPSIKMLAEVSKQTSTIIVGGSIPERDDVAGNIYNTSCVFDEQGNLISMHRKLHLFDIDIPGKMTFQESQTLTGGDRVTVFDCSLGRFGLGICYDLRFPESAMIAARLGAGVMIYPGAFNTTTGPVSWELLLRARATDNQIFTIGCSPARPSVEAIDGTLTEAQGWRTAEKAYPAWGHSTVVGPTGQVKKKLDEKEGILYITLDSEEHVQVRKNIPITTQRRFDVYPDITCG